MFRSVPPRGRSVAVAISLGVLGAASSLQAQQAQQAQPAAAPALPPSPAVGEAAPDFALSGATRYGVLRQPVRLSDFRGQTVVIAFFPRARSKG